MECCKNCVMSILKRKGACPICRGEISGWNML
ncbi:MAG: hypothetical protein EBS19_14665 [Spirochaetia bacterium]|nr:hypothetical protein [Spirochaetia bacterium]